MGPLLLPLLGFQALLGTQSYMEASDLKPILHLEGWQSIRSKACLQAGALSFPVEGCSSPPGDLLLLRNCGDTASGSLRNRPTLTLLLL